MLQSASIAAVFSSVTDLVGSTPGKSFPWLTRLLQARVSGQESHFVVVRVTVVTRTLTDALYVVL